MAHHLYFGTSTHRQARGIYRADFDPNTGKLSNLTLFFLVSNPTFLSFDQKGRLYSVTSQTEKGELIYFSDEARPHVLPLKTPLSSFFLDEKRELIYGVTQKTGELFLSLEQTKGALEPSVFKTPALFPIGFLTKTPDGYLLTCVPQEKAIITYEVSPTLTLRRLFTYQMTTDHKPGQLVFHPHIKVAYLLHEGASSLDVLFYDGVGEFEHFQTLSTLLEAPPLMNKALALCLSTDGSYLYVCNSGCDLITVFGVQADGSLTILESLSSHGKNLRDILLTPDQGYLIAVHTDSDNASIFKRHPKTGRLTIVSDDFYIPEAVCLCFKP